MKSGGGNTADNQWIRHTVDLNGDYLIQAIDDDKDAIGNILYTERTGTTVNYTNLYGKLALPTGDLDMVDDKKHDIAPSEEKKEIKNIEFIPTEEDKDFIYFDNSQDLYDKINETTKNWDK